jgi:hypothetical protein
MDPIDLGDLSVGPDPNGRDLRFTIATQLPTVTLSREGATELWAYLFHWLGMPAEATPREAPTAREEIVTFLRSAGDVPAKAEPRMAHAADTIFAHGSSTRLGAWLDSLEETPLTPEEIAAIVAEIRQRRAR